MKDIGEKLKEARKNIGISIEEAAEDLKLHIDQITNLEEGNMTFFQDILYLKNFIRDYAKYLGLDKEQLVDEFNEYLFDYTSKLSIDDIKKGIKNKKEEESKIKSPYTVEIKNEKIFQSIAYIAIILLLLIVSYFLYTIINSDNGSKEENIVMIGD